MQARAVFLDKDGTLVEDVPYNVDVTRLRWLPGAVTGMQRLHAAGFRLIVVSNQSGVARGYFGEESLALLAEYMRGALANHSVPLTGFYYCPHHPDGSDARYAHDCSCRKPQPGLILRAAKEHDLDLHKSWVVGNAGHDIEAGRRAGCRTILVSNGDPTETFNSPSDTPHYVSSDLIHVAAIITAGVAAAQSETTHR